ncbi:helix-turn-helix domain-containing protein [Thermus scotoductus]|uniref:helix-turn-helix domain-containing protein n=1 Tax=Thermus scotoductus TaxID=37636 RepID=UPI00056E3FE1|nr:helix-turn-helix domain-containing protein [Thermus scotoductus]
MNPDVIWRLAEAKGLPVRAAYTPRQAALLLGIGKNAVYEAVRSGRVKSLQVGRVRYVPITELVKLLEGRGA